MDLVEIVPNASPPVCRVMNYGKFQFDQNKKRQAAKKKQKQIHVKEVKFRPGTDEGDYQVKLRNLVKFLLVSAISAFIAMYSCHLSGTFSSR